ncbi:LysR substrate-binding domain-containing protein [Mesorhizobium sangaii]|uniref:DNA-binding transcriptional LysR family regulator n=1 Tax=Mesorhizobium sangaii TaxID=505389 RepID=A0A841PEJ1_9HYPH|nr:DNA-binding transcriptional LysR family regulator [Mesorhizobium sangaii]
MPDETIDDAALDIVEAGYDVSARLGEFLEADMVAAALGGTQRQLAVASPDYLARDGSPSAPADLLLHHCINWRRPGSAGPYAWEFARDGQWFSVAVNGPLVVSSRDMAIAAAVQGVGIAFWAEDLVRPLIDAGKLVSLLDDWCAAFPGWFLCYQKQRHTSPTVRSFVDFLRHAHTGRRTPPRG